MHNFEPGEAATPEGQPAESGEPPEQPNAGQLRIDELRLGKLREQNFTGPVYDQIVDELWEYALPVLLSQLGRGTIFRWCLDSGIAVHPTPDERRVLHSSREERDKLAVLTIAEAVPVFRSRVLLRGAWDARKRASLSTYFIGRVKFEFVDVFREWQRDRAATHAALLGPTHLESGTLDALFFTPSLDPEKRAIDQDTINYLTRGGQPEARPICALILKGYTYAEIGQQLHLTERAVEYRMRQLRKHVARLVTSGQLAAPTRKIILQKSRRVA